MIGYPLVTRVTGAYGWPTVFYLCGGIGIVWSFLWMWDGRGTPEEHPSVTPGELSYIQAERVKPMSEHHGWAPVLRSPRVWALATSYTLWVYNMWLMASWLPSYLVKGRGFSVSEMGVLGGAITGAALVGTVVGGWLSDRLLSRGFSANTARKTIPTISMLIGAPLMVLGVSVESPWVCVGLLMAARLFNDSALAGYMSLPTEMSPRHLGAIWGCMSTFGSLAGMVAAMLTGYQVTATGNWALPFYTAAGSISVAALIMALGVSAEPLRLTEPSNVGAIRPAPVKG